MGVALKAALVGWINVLSPPSLPLLLCSGLLSQRVGKYRKSMNGKSILYKSILKWQKTTTARWNRFATPLLKINIRLNLAVKIDILWWWGSPRVFDKAPTRCRYSRTSMTMLFKPSPNYEMNISSHTNKAGINNQPFTNIHSNLIQPVFPLEQQTSVSLRFISFSDISAHKRHDFGVSSVCIESLQPNFKARFKGNYSGASGCPGWRVSKNSIPYLLG